MIRYEKSVGMLELLPVTKRKRNKGGGNICSGMAEFLTQNSHFK